jgi:hypothetical protein
MSNGPVHASFVAQLQHGLTGAANQPLNASAAPHRAHLAVSLFSVAQIR